MFLISFIYGSMAIFFILCVCVQWSPELQGKEAVCDYGASATTKGGHYGEKISVSVSLVGTLTLI